MKSSPYAISPINQHFTKEIAHLERDLLRMGALVEVVFRYSHKALFHRDLGGIETISLLDRKIDRFYRKIESECILLLSRQHDVARNSRLLGAYMQLVRDLERIGDYAEDLAEIAVKLFPYPTHAKLSEVEAMSRFAQAMLSKSLVALAELDAEAGRGLREEDSTVNEAYERLYLALARQQDVRGSIEPILLLTLAIRHLERMADHAANIGQRVAYVVTGVRN